MSTALTIASLRLLAATPNAGFALQNGTPTILSYTFPADGKKHRFCIFSTLAVTGAATGGSVSFAWTCAGIIRNGFPIFAGSGAAGFLQTPNFPNLMIADPGSTVTIAQDAALTAGAATAFAEIWGI